MAAPDEDDKGAHHSTNGHRSLLTNPEVRGWYDEMAQRNEGTAEDDLRRLYRYRRAVGTTPARIVAMARREDGGRRAVERALSEFMDLLKRPLKPADHAQPEDFPADLARKAAEATLCLRSRDVRQAIRIARLARMEEHLAKVVETIRRRQ